MGEFILSGFVANGGASRPNRKLKIIFSDVINKPNNTSVVTVTGVQLSFDFGALFWLDGYIKINGQTAATLEANSDPLSSVTTVNGQWSNVININAVPITINHNVDGTGSCVFTFAEKHGFYVYPSANKGVYCYQQGGSNHTVFPNPNLTIQLTTIPRESPIFCDDTTLGTSKTVTVTKYSSAFLTTIKVYDSDMNLIETIANKSTATSFTFNPTYATYGPCFRSNETIYPFLLACETYNGSSLVGVSYKTVQVTMPENAATKPTASYVLTDASTNPGVFVQSHSTLHVVTTASAKYNATIATIFVEFDGKRLSGSSVTTNEIEGSGSMPLRIIVTDSRGFSAIYEQTVTVCPWSMPSVTDWSLTRCDEDGNEDDGGEYMRFSATVSVSPLGNVNTKTFKTESKLASATSWTQKETGTLASYSLTFSKIYSDYSADNAYDGRLTISDFYSQVVLLGSIQSEFQLINYHDSGTGIAFGKVAEKSNYFDCAIPVCGNVASLFGNDAEIPSGADLNSYKECGTWSVIANTTAASLLNCPSQIAGTLIVRDGNARGRSTSQTQCRRQQVYIPYTADSGFFVRTVYCTNDTSSWTYGVWQHYSPYVDGITEEGTSGGWFYRIWSSGKKELWYSGTFSSVAMTTERNAEYISNDYSINYPNGLTFTTKVIVTTNAEARSSTTYPVRTYNVQATQASGLHFRFSTGASQTIPVNFSAYILFW